jgi:hypothetical protein
MMYLQKKTVGLHEAQQGSAHKPAHRVPSVSRSSAITMMTVGKEAVDGLRIIHAGINNISRQY